MFHHRQSRGLCVAALMLLSCSEQKGLLTNFVSPIAIAGVTVTPPLALPGQLTTIAVFATATTGTAVHYQWTVPDGWTVVGATDTNTLTLQAPDTFGATATVALTADDGQGRSVSTTIAVATVTNVAPVVTVSSNPTNPTVGTPIVLTSAAQATGGQAVTYAWTLRQMPEGSTASLTQSDGALSGFTPDLAGTYAVELVVTDAQGMPSLPAKAILPIPYSAPSIVAVTASPSVAAPGGQVRLQASAVTTDGYAPNFTWTLPADWVPLEPSTGDTIVVVAPTRFGATATGLVTVDEGHGLSTTASIPLATGPDAAPTVEVTTNPTDPQVGSPVTMTAEVSASAGRTVSYTWTLRQAPAGSTAALAQADEAASTFTPDVPGSYVVRLIVMDDSGLATTTTVTIQASGFLPPTIASLTASPAAVPPSGLIVVSATATSADGYPLHYAWALPAGWQAVGATDSASLILMAPTTFSTAGLVTLTVDEGHGATATGSVVVRTTDDAAPTVSISATPTRPVVASTVLLTSQASAEAGQSVSHAWSLTLRPSGSTAALLNAASANATFVPDAAGDYTVQLVVTDSAGLSSLPATLTITASAFSAPTISALTASPAVVEPLGMVLITSQAATTDGYPLNYTWTIPSGWTASGATDKASLLLVAPATYGATGQLLLTVDEGHGASASQLVILRTTANSAPTVTVGSSPTNPRVGTPVTFTSHASAQGGQTVTYAWSLVATPAGSTATLTGATLASATFTPDVPGDYVGSLVVTDASGLSSAPARTTVSVLGFSAPTITNLTATPATVAPGGFVSVAATITSTDGFPNHNVWSVPTGWTNVGPSNGDSIIVAAPTLYGATGRITLTSDDTHGASASASTLVSTTADTPPAVTISMSPTNPVIGAPVAATSQVTTLGGQSATYAWTLTARPTGSTTALASSTQATATFLPDVPGTYALQLVVTDASGMSTTANGTVSVSGYSAPKIQSLSAAPPTAPPGGAITLVAVVDSTDGFPLHYSWTIPTGWTAATTTDGNSIGLIAPATFGVSSLVLLTVDEGHGASSSSSVIVSTTADEAPTVSLSSSPTNPVIGARVNLAAHASVTGGQAVTYAWSLVSLPTGSTATISAAAPATNGFTPDVAGTYVASVVATDASGLSSQPATATITVSGFLPPILQSVTATPSVATPGGFVSIAASVTSADGYPLHYTWTIPSGWTASSATDGSTLVLKAPNLYGQSASLLLTVDEGHGASTSTSVLLSTTPDTAPVASITSSPSNPFAGTRVTATAHATVLGNQAVTYAWSLLAVPTGSVTALSSASGASVIFTPDLPGNYLVQLIATDASGLSSTPVISSIPVASFTAPDITATIVTPKPVTPGGLVSVAATAQTTDGFDVHYTWTVPNGWTPMGPVTGDVLILSAPTAFGTQAQLLLTVDDGHGASATSSAILETAADTPPEVTLTFSPTNPRVLTPITVQSHVLAANNQAVTYAWTLLGAPQGSTVTLSSLTAPTLHFTPDLVGNYVVQLVVTNEAGTASTPAVVTITASNPAPIAVIAGTPPLKGVINTPLVLDGSGSSNPAGNALSFTWGFLGLPPGSACSAACFTQGNGLGLENFKPDVAGLYSIQLTVTDVVTGLSASATTSVSVSGAAQIVVVSGNLQSSTTKTALLDPAIVKVVAADGITPIPGLQVSFVGANLSATPTTAITDANGKASTLVVLGRVAGPSRLRAFITTIPTISTSMTFTTLADGISSSALLASTGTTDSSVPFSVTVVDRYGNPTRVGAGGQNDPSNASVYLVVESPSGLATFSPSSSRGDIVTFNTNPPRAIATLDNGLFSGSVNDPVVESIIITILPGPNGAVRPLSSWTTLLLDDAEITTGRQTSTVAPTTYPASFRNDGAAGDKRWALSLPAGVQAGTADISLSTAAPIVPVTGSPITMLSFKSNIGAVTTYDTIGKCWWQPSFRMQVSGSVIPLDGYDILTGCGNGNAAPFLGPTSGAVTKQADLTDVLLPPYSTALSFTAHVAPDANLPPTSVDVNWTLDDIWVRSLNASSYAGSQSNATVTAGVPKSATLVAAPNVAGASPPPYTVLVEVLDANGNPTSQAALVRVDWSGATGLISLLNSPDNVSQLLPSGVILLVPGKLLLQVTDSVAETLTFTASSPSLNVFGSPISVAPPVYRSHSTGTGRTWQDTAPSGTYNAIQALTACQTQYPTGACVVGTNYAYPTILNPPSCSASVWVFSSFTTTATNCAGAATIAAGRVGTATPYSSATSACACGPMGETQNVSISGSATWN